MQGHTVPGGMEYAKKNGNIKYKSHTELFDTTDSVMLVKKII